jgi:hypothetical protein
MTTAEERTQEVVEALSRFVNTFTLDHVEFNKQMSTQHRTLQQSFTRLCLLWLNHVASDEYRHDGRNQYSHETAKEIKDLLEKARGYDFKIAANCPMI